MNVACAVQSMSENYRRWFPDLTIIGHEDNIPRHIDLLILTGGGADISPDRYGDLPRGSSGVDLERDAREFNIVKTAMEMNTGVKFLGVCRGLQLLNVFFGGNLIQDMSSAGLSHGGVHPIQHRCENPFSWLTVVNSMHHQAIRSLGENASYATLMAMEPITSLAEIVAWQERAIGVQFHPEMFSDDIGNRFFSLIAEWVGGSLAVSAKDKESSTRYYPAGARITIPAFGERRIGLAYPDIVHLEIQEEDQEEDQEDGPTGTGLG